MESTCCYFHLLLILALTTAGLSVRCYICSYSPDDRNNRTDKCTEENFQYQKVYIHDCKYGCETFVQYDTNEMLEHWRRNCATEGTEITNNCKTDKTRFLKKITCTCDRDLCNGGMSPVQRRFWLIPLLTMTTWTFSWMH